MADESTPGYHELRQHLMDNPIRGLWERASDPAVEWLAERNVPVLSEWANDVAMGRAYQHEAWAHYEAAAILDARANDPTLLGINQMLEAIAAPTLEAADRILDGRISAVLAQTERPPWTPDPQRQAEVAWAQKHHGFEPPTTTPVAAAQGELPVDNKAQLIASGQAMQARIADGTAFQGRGQGQDHEISR